MNFPGGGKSLRIFFLVCKMAFRRRRFRKRFSRPSRFRRNRFTRRFGRRKLSGKVHTFTRWVDYGLINSTTGTDPSSDVSYSIGGVSFGTGTNTRGVQLADLPNYTEFQNLFDQYKIYRVMVKILPMSNINGLTTGGGNESPYVRSALDYSDSVPFAAAAARTSLQQYENFKMTPFWRQHVRTFRPRVSMFISDPSNPTTAKFVGYTSSKAQWIDYANPYVGHNGMKFSIDYNASLEVANFRVMAKVWVACRNVN